MKKIQHRCRLDEMQCTEECHGHIKTDCVFMTTTINGKKVHYLKTWSEYYNKIATGEKTFEMRKNDRDFKVGDILCLQDFNPVTEKYSGEELWKEITHILGDSGNFGIEKGFVGLSFKEFVA